MMHPVSRGDPGPRNFQLTLEDLLTKFLRESPSLRQGLRYQIRISNGTSRDWSITLYDTDTDVLTSSAVPVSTSKTHCVGCRPHLNRNPPGPDP